MNNNKDSLLFTLGMNKSKSVLTALKVVVNKKISTVLQITILN